MRKAERRWIGAGLAVHLLPWPAVRTGALRAWEAVRRRYFLTGTSWEVLELVTRLQWVHAVEGGSHAVYATPSETWLAEQLGVCRETISDAVCVLAGHGLLRVTRRRPVNRCFVTNLYQMAGRVAASLVASVRRARGARAGVSHPPARGALRETRTSHAGEDGKLRDLVRRWLARGGDGEVGGNG